MYVYMYIIQFESEFTGSFIGPLSVQCDPLHLAVT